MRLLIIEDEHSLLDSLSEGLRIKGYSVDCADNGEDGLTKALEEDYDLIVLDLNLPQINGLQLLEHLTQEKPNIKVIILSANIDLNSKLRGFDLGAIDYMVKPFHFEELEVRIRLLLHREFVQKALLLTYDGLELNTQSRSLTYYGNPLTLTAKELALFEYFLLNIGRLISQQELIEHVWDESVDAFSNSIRVHMSALRKKLKAALHYDPIKTKIGEGYILYEKN